jgi:hypothetical protein
MSRCMLDQAMAMLFGGSIDRHLFATAGPVP